MTARLKALEGEFTRAREAFEHNYANLQVEASREWWEAARKLVRDPGRAHRALARRCGDYILLARDDYAFATSLPGAKPDFNTANHGGLSARELLVPLFVIQPYGGIERRAKGERTSRRA